MSKKLTDLASPITKLRNAIERFVSRRFGSISERQVFWTGFALLCIITTFLINNPLFRTTVENYKEGDLLLTLERKSEKEILTFWGKYQPSVPQNEKSGKVYFRKMEQ